MIQRHQRPRVRYSEQANLKIHYFIKNNSLKNFSFVETVSKTQPATSLMYLLFEAIKTLI